MEYKEQSYLNEKAVDKKIKEIFRKFDEIILYKSINGRERKLKELKEEYGV